MTRVIVLTTFGSINGITSIPQLKICAGLHLEICKPDSAAFLVHAARCYGDHLFIFTKF